MYCKLPSADIQSESVRSSNELGNIKSGGSLFKDMHVRLFYLFSYCVVIDKCVVPACELVEKNGLGMMGMLICNQYSVGPELCVIFTLLLSLQ